MNRFFVSPAQIENTLITITGSDVNHISRVLRLKPGDQMMVADGTGREYLVELISATPEKVETVIKESFPAGNEPPLDVYLLQGLPKGEKMELIIQKCTEIGIKKIIPVQMERTIIKLTPDKAEKRRERWQRISFEAAKQCQRSMVPEVLSVCELPQAINQLPKDTLIIMPWEEEKGLGLKELLRNNGSLTGSVALIIGPEGGISPQEAAWAVEQGVKIVSLGPRILRTETAGLVTISIVLYELGDLGGKIVG
ncbi:MAG: 16S rRNA (uracil(1498)-N(3))-methyltransferase [Bacillota bacterium]|jgi:16S rRNA (uracil1498-N3)-methyltransferase